MTDLFQQQEDQPQVDPNKNYLEDLVGEGKKFKDNESLARGKFESDQYVELMKKRMDTLRNDYLQLKTDYDSRAKLEDLIESMTQRQQSASSDAPDAKEESRPQFDPTQVEQLVSSKIQEHEQTKRQEENYNKVRAKLREHYGDNFQNVLRRETESLGLSEEFVNNLARSHPDVLYKTLGLDQAKGDNLFQTPPQSGRTFAPVTEQKKTWSFYQKMKATDPKTYYNPKTQVQMHKDAIALGEEFKDGDYRAYGD